MFRHRTKEGQINTDGWMMSYADMVTILLAMFIVLSTLGKDQTGLSLQHATGSFSSALRDLGLPGFFSTSAHPIPLSGPMPHYLFSPPGPSRDSEGRQPRRILDGDEEQLQRFLVELKRQFPCERQPRQVGQVIVDVYEPLGKQSPYLTARHNEVLREISPFLQRPDYRVQLVVWAATPAPAAWLRAVNQAQLAVQEFASEAALDESARGRLLPVGQPWQYRDVHRPYLSLVLTKRE